MKAFTGQFTQQEAIPDEAIAAAVEVLKSGRLHRYNTLGSEPSVTSELERDYAVFQGAKYCLACASGGYAMSIALRATGVAPGDKILTNSFTLAPVPGAIASVGAVPVLVEITPDLVIDLHDLRKKISGCGAKHLLLSNMRGHLCDMDELVGVLNETGVTLIEDCAHTMGARWNGALSGNFGLAGCFSAQTYKHINSGEGGLLTSDDPDFMARAIMLSGSYMLYERHGAAPAEHHFNDARLDTPNMSGRMDNLRAAILKPQIAVLEENIQRWNERYDLVAGHLSRSATIVLRERSSKEFYVGSSIQFRIPGIAEPEARQFVANAKSLGVELKWFGDVDPVAFTSNHHSWRYLERQKLPQTDDILAGLFDMRIPLTFSLDDCQTVSEIIVHCATGLVLDGAA
ncbi:DegT/DnrJ/EryC1/StrS family aminotransferase [uncultured Roseibium sp.]|uniref:DegT/DnrJ/EryC1/StrS family aminotransferase n=1 Tax=uncultured Roseibium sp. TaxID=1936171 RepID=UPI00262C081C|nr:DegT/DnrJ/EryC1/StrS family aminotransferase [uncultured Roseibium sp.]